MNALKLHTLTLCLLVLGCAVETEATSTICADAEEFVASCGGGQAPSFGTCTPELEAESARLLEAGCDEGGKADSATCIGALARFLPWCGAQEVVCEPSDADLDPTLCNGEDVCARRYDQVSYAMSNHAPYAADMGFETAHQEERIFYQLEAGIRGLHMRVTLRDGELGFCQGGYCTPAADGFQEVLDFLDCHPSEVVTLLVDLDHRTHEAEVVELMEAVGFPEYTEAPADVHPTLGSMVERDKRLVIYGQRRYEEPVPAWYRSTLRLSRTASTMDTYPGDCAGDELIVLSHHHDEPDRFAARTTNSYRLLADNIRGCAEDRDDYYVAFIKVDHIERGDLLEIVSDMNGGRESR